MCAIASGGLAFYYESTDDEFLWTPTGSVVSYCFQVVPLFFVCRSGSILNLLASCSTYTMQIFHVKNMAQALLNDAGTATLKFYLILLLHSSLLGRKSGYQKTFLRTSVTNPSSYLAGTFSTMHQSNMLVLHRIEFFTL